MTSKYKFISCGLHHIVTGTGVDSRYIHLLATECFEKRLRPKVNDGFFKLNFPVAVLNSVLDFATEIHFGREKTELANC